MDDGFSIILITAGCPEEARLIANTLLDRSLAACVNIIPGIESHFRWKGKLETASECLVMAKSRASCLDAIIEQVTKIHSYEVPEIIALPVIGGSLSYLRWLGEEISGPPAATQNRPETDCQ
jgi:periplasmic divalent cation tolerance protein